MIARIKKYLREIQLEWDKVSKPNWKTVQGNTLVVIVACIVLGIFLWLVDGSKYYPDWSTGYGMILLIALIPIIILTAKRLTPKWRLAIPISLVPLAVAILSQYVLHRPITGFGLALLRKLFIQEG